ncbi:MAG: prefoldin subunit [Candidatus Diapherotrites archaeon]
MADELQTTISEFERTRGQMMVVANQKQQIQFHANSLKAALDELAKTKEKKVYKAVGNILILSDTAEVKKEIEGQKETSDLKVKTLQKQEDAFVDKLNRLKNTIESAQKSTKDGSKKDAKSDF